MNASREIKRAMVLAAGLGTRLRPMTYKVPKPLLPLDSKKLIDYPLFYLAKNGIKEVMINLHHLGDMIREYVGDGSRYNLEITYSFEPEILGTGGGIKNVEGFFKGEPFVCLNSDSLLNADFHALISRHFETDASATMVVKKIGLNDPYEGVGVEKGFIKNIGGGGEYFYTGLQVIGGELLKILPPAGSASCLIKDGYQKLLSDGKRVAAFVYDGYFSDLGTPDRYERAKNDITGGVYRPVIS